MSSIPSPHKNSKILQISERDTPRALRQTPLRRCTPLAAIQHALVRVLVSVSGSMGTRLSSATFGNIGLPENYEGYLVTFSISNRSSLIL